MDTPRHYAFFDGNVMVAKVAGHSEGEAKSRLAEQCRQHSGNISLEHLTVAPFDNRYGWTMDTLVLEQDIKVWKLV